MQTGHLRAQAENNHLSAPSPMKWERAGVRVSFPILSISQILLQKIPRSI